MGRFRLIPLLFGLLLVWTSIPGAPAEGVSPAPAEWWLTRTATGEPRVHLYFFWTRTCPHCRQARPLVEALPADYPWLELHSHDITRDMAGGVQYARMAAALGESANSVPAFLFCGRMMTGFDRPEPTGQQLRQQLEDCRRHLAEPTAAEPVAVAAPPLELPLVGRLDPGALSLPVLTVVLAGLDAFNPCAFFVLLFLLSLLAHQRDRRRMLLVGGIFVATSGLMYFAFMAAWLNVFLLVGMTAALRVGLAVVAMLIGLINVKDFFAFRRGVSLSIPESAKPGLYARARAILKAESLPASLAAVAALAVVVNFVELLCTAGLPAIYTAVLTGQDLSPLAHYGYLGLYILAYIADDALMVGTAVLALGSGKLGERGGRMLKLLSGVVMLALGAVMLLRPEWLM